MYGPISVLRELVRANAEPPQRELWNQDGSFEEEEVEPEEGRELPIGVDDPALVSEADLRPIRAGKVKGEE